MKSKIHMARITKCVVDYEGSIEIDREFMDMVGIQPFERVLVANVESGKRFETYVIEGVPGAKEIGLNGAAAHKGKEVVFPILWIATIEADPGSEAPESIHMAHVPPIAGNVAAGKRIFVPVASALRGVPEPFILIEVPVSVADLMGRYLLRRVFLDHNSSKAPGRRKVLCDPLSPIPEPAIWDYEDCPNVSSC